ncbi:WD40-repeat-containing domain protein [Suillus subluteus]|nr:WD40-repeat-containing domain protein [Suillus subluteus]
MNHMLFPLWMVVITSTNLFHTFPIFPMASGSGDKTIRRWDLRERKEIEEARLKGSDFMTGIVRTFHEDLQWITGIDISVDNILLAGASTDRTVRIWNLDPGKLVTGPFKCSDDAYPGDLAPRFSKDSEAGGIQARKLDIQRSTPVSGSIVPVFWTAKDKFVAQFRFTIDDYPMAIYNTINGLALSSDCVLLAGSSYDTIKLWTFQSRQFLASFDVQNTSFTIVLSPDSRQLAYTLMNDTKIYIWNIPANILASIGLAEELQPSTSKSDVSYLHQGLSMPDSMEATGVVSASN